MKKLSLEQFNKKLEDNGIVYTCVMYNTNRKLSLFSCPEQNHPYFEGKSGDVLYGKKQCPLCTNKIVKHTPKSFNIKLEKAGIKYRCVEYITSKKTSLFSCPEQNHPHFHGVPDDVLRGKKSCPCCTKDRKNLFNLKLKNKNILYVCKTYNGSDKKSEFSCVVPEHPNFWVDPNDVLCEKRGCPICTNHKQRKSWNLDLYNKFLNENNRNIICHEFITCGDKTKHECLVCGYGKNGEWTPKPNYLLHCGSGCPICADTTFDLNKKAILYYIKIYWNDVKYYKIGITTRTIKKRFVDEGIKYDVIFSKKYEFGKDAKKTESILIDKYKEYSYIGNKIMRYTGNTEIFIKDVFNGNYDLTFLVNCDTMNNI